MAKANTKRANKEPQTKPPMDLRKSLAAVPKAEAAWNDLTPIARRDFASWIDSAKQAQTRQRRIERACENLAAGKRRPCCYAVVPMDVYRALGANPKAKARWGELDANERRDLTDWVESAKDRETRQRRIDKACELLAAGKRCP